MRAYYFTEMPYPYYPPEVAQQLHSQRVILPNRYCDPKLAGELYNRYLDEYEYADELGLDLMLNEHHQTVTCINSVMPLTAAAIARRTRRAKLLLLGNPIANRDNPVRVAEEMAFLDCVTQGRLICGFVRGVATEYHPANTNPALTRERFEEAHDLIMHAWTTHAPFNWEGKFWHYRYVNPWPRPYQQPHPPIWITGSSPSSVRWIADHQYVHACFLQPYEEQERLHQVYRERGRERGLPEPGPDKFGFLALVYVGDTDEQASEEGRALMWYLQAVQHPGFVNPPGYNAPETSARMYRGEGRRGAGKSWEELNDLGIAIWGNPDTVIKKITYLHERCQVGHLMMMMQAGFMPTEHTRKSLKLFAEEVYPAIRELGEPLEAPQEAAPRW
jgi:alkanesulfonate monooxygenase SsuD/methylene tetrahydromethanopterin reductase-like flavin-dependent oxidoreductase (luciferase family)